MSAARRALVCAVIGVALPTMVPNDVAAQRSPDVAPAPPGTVRDERSRLAQLSGDETTDGYLARSASSQPSARALGAASNRLRVLGVAPQVTLRWNSALPAAANDGMLWAARGASGIVRAGMVAELGPLRVILLPEVAHTQNRPFGALPSTVAGRSPYATPFHTGLSAGDAPIDLPLRFGDRPRTTIGGGQSSIALSYRAVSVGVATENEWWGPGIETALVLSSAASGFPHAFLRTTRPLRTALGAVEGRVLAGTLTSSTFFDAGLTDRFRSFSGAIVTLRPAALPQLTVGVERAVIRSAPRATTAAGRALDVLTIWERPPTDADEAARAAGTLTGRKADQLTGLVARLVAPESGAEGYAEWVRQELPRSLREFLLSPQTSQGYTVGAQWISPATVADRPRLRLRGEASTVEQSITIRGLAVRDFYAGFATREGYTHRGQPLGAATGPGSSAQRLGADLVAPRWQGGLFATRVRWDNDALYRQPAVNYYRHDVSLTAGLRGAVRLARWDVGAEAAYADRINYLFQNGFNNPGGVRTVDVHDVSFSLSVTPR